MARGQWVARDRVRWARTGGHLFSVDLYEMGIAVTAAPSDREQALVWRKNPSQAELRRTGWFDPDVYPLVVHEPRTPYSSLFLGPVVYETQGASIRWGRVPDTTHLRLARLVILTPVVAMAGLLLPALCGARWLLRRDRRLSRLRKGLCARCGYDLRESAGRCPECGETIPDELTRGSGIPSR